ncbi:MAG: hypothetical protein HYU57_02540 [Micavibrio aeruginosavorus]|nr:hypothetical protein [Micavibrio aeruginosavorus]
MSEDKPQVEIYNRINRLKIKAGGTATGGPGKIDQNSIDRANAVLHKMSEQYPDEIKKCLEDLNGLWNETKAMASDKRSANARAISNVANQIKDLAGTFGFDLMEYFGESLRDYILNIDLSQKEQVIIVQAHIDVMQVAYSQNLKHQEHPLGEELKKTVAAAIAKYS